MLDQTRSMAMRQRRCHRQQKRRRAEALHIRFIKDPWWRSLRLFVLPCAAVAAATSSSCADIGCPSPMARPPYRPPSFQNFNLAYIRGGGGSSSSTGRSPDSDDDIARDGANDILEADCNDAVGDAIESNEIEDGNATSTDDVDTKEAYSLSGITRNVSAVDDVSPPVDNSSSEVEKADDINDAMDNVDNANESETQVPLPLGKNEANEKTDNLASASNKATSLTEISDTIYEMLLRHRQSSGEESEKAGKLRDLVLERCQEYMDDVHSRISEESSEKKKQKHPRDPKKVLHYLAARIPAIKKSPDITLRIKNANVGVDSCTAAYTIGAIGCMSELFVLSLSESESETRVHNHEQSESSSATSGILSDRRLEQLLECVLCGIDVKGKLREAKNVPSDLNGDSESESDSLGVSDTAFAAFGLALIGIQDLPSIAGLTPREVFSVLSLHCKDVLLAKHKKLRVVEHHSEEMVDNLVRELASALWAFACVKSMTGHRCDQLFDVCCSILLNKEATNNCADISPEKGDTNSSNSAAASNDKHEESVVSDEHGSSPLEPSSTAIVLGDTLVGRLEQRDLINVIWALALHGSSDNKSLHWNSENEVEGNAASSPSAFSPSDMVVDLLLGRMGHILANNIASVGDSPAEMFMRANGNGCTDIESNADEEDQLHSEGEITDIEDQTEIITGIETENDEVQNGLEQLHGVEAGSQDNSSLEDQKRVDEAVGDKKVVVEVISAAAILEEEARQMGDDSAEAGHQTLESPTKDDQLTETMDATFVDQNELSEIDASNKMIEPVLKEDEPIDGLSAEIPEVDESILNESLSIRDMCSIAWAATELSRDESVNIVWQITILFCYSQENFASIGITSLSNLAWAIAKNLEASNGSTLKPHVLTIVNFIAEKSLAILTVEESNGKRVPPPELSRLCWALAIIDTASKGILSGNENHSAVFTALVAEALKVTARNIAAFSVEDLARVLWSFCELGDAASASTKLKETTANSFGRIQATIESSLLHWESGQKNTTSSSRQHKEKNNIFSHFPSTFFGKARHRRLSLLDLKISDDEDEAADGASSQTGKRKSLPTLRDLTVDPSTLCKLAHGLSQIARNHNFIIGSEQILRISSRLFSSKGGRLLSECSHQDIVRLTCACGDTMKLAGKEIRGADREVVLRQLPRRLVQYVNTQSHEDGAFQRSYLEELSPSDLSALLFGLGELGVKASSQPISNPALEYRRLRMIPICPLLTEERLGGLTTTSLVNLVCGLISIGDASDGSKALLSIISHLQTNVETLDSQLLCRLIASLSKLLRTGVSASSITERSEKVSPEDQNGSIAKEKQVPPDEINNKEDKEAKTDLEITAEQVIDNLPVSPHCLNATEILMKEARSLLKSVLERTVVKISELSVEQIRRILLHVAVLLPFQSDELIVAVEEEIKIRKSALDVDNEASGNQQRQEGVSRLKTNLVLREIEQGVAFELGRCETLIERYRRIQFNERNFSRRSRYDDEKRKEIGKRVCSRLFV